MTCKSIVSCSHVISDSNSTIVTLRSRIRGQKMRFLSDIYDQQDADVNHNVNFALITYQPSIFDEANKDQVCIMVMDEKIDAIEMNDTWELVYLS